MPVWLQADTNVLNVLGSPLVVLGIDITKDTSMKPFSEWSEDCTLALHQP